eukprot:Gb_06661 [translate_table: standard]
MDFDFSIFGNKFSAILLFAVGLMSFYVFCSTQTRRKPDKPKSYPIVGSLFSFWMNRHRLLEWDTELVREAPTQTFKFQRLGGMKSVVTANPVNVEHILKTRFDNYPKGDFFTGLLEDLLGRGIFNADGEIWKMQRRIASYEFNTKSLRNFIVEAVEGEITDRLLPLLKKAGEEGDRLNMQDVLKRFAFDNICKVAFGMDPCCLEISLPVSEFAEAFDVAVELSVRRFSTPVPFLWKIKRMFNLGSEKRLRQAIKVVHSFALQVIGRRKEELSHRATREHQDLLSRFLSAVDTKPDEEIRGGSHEEFLRDVVISFILAGRDTTSAALTWFFWLLSSQPQVEEAIHEEICRVMAARETREEAEEWGGVFSYEELKGMNYLHAAICESMRLYPPVPSDTKHALEDDVLPDGTVVSKGTRVTYLPYAMGRMESIWGADCLEFKPERWLKKEEDGSMAFVAESPFKFTVFQAGPRICLGKEMAFIQMKCIAASVIKGFSFKVDPHFSPKLVATLTSVMKGGLPMTFVERAEIIGSN